MDTLHRRSVARSPALNGTETRDGSWTAGVTRFGAPHSWLRLAVALFAALLFGLPLGLTLHRDLVSLNARLENAQRSQALLTLALERRLETLLGADAAVREQRLDLLRREISFLRQQVEAARGGKDAR